MKGIYLIIGGIALTIIMVSCQSKTLLSRKGDAGIVAPTDRVKMSFRGPGGCLKEYHITNRRVLYYVFGQCSEYMGNEYAIVSISDSGSMHISHQSIMAINEIVSNCSGHPSKTIGLSVLDGWHNQLIVDTIICVDRYGSLGKILEDMIHEVNKYKPLRFEPDCL